MGLGRAGGGAEGRMMWLTARPPARRPGKERPPPARDASPSQPPPAVEQANYRGGQALLQAEGGHDRAFALGRRAEQRSDVEEGKFFLSLFSLHIIFPFDSPRRGVSTTHRPARLLHAPRGREISTGSLKTRTGRVSEAPQKRAFARRCSLSPLPWTSRTMSGTRRPPCTLSPCTWSRYENRERKGRREETERKRGSAPHRAPFSSSLSTFVSFLTF